MRDSSPKSLGKAKLEKRVQGLGHLRCMGLGLTCISGTTYGLPCITDIFPKHHCVWLPNKKREGWGRKGAPKRLEAEGPISVKTRQICGEEGHTVLTVGEGNLFLPETKPLSCFRRLLQDSWGPVASLQQKL